MQNIVQIDGQKYIERPQIFPLEQAVTVNGQIIANQQLTLPGVAYFWLKMLTRETIVAGAAAARRFRFKWGTTDGGVYYSSGGTGGLTSRVLDTLCFGDARFPFVVTPFVLYQPTAGITWEVEDVSNNVPYTIFFAFHGSFLIPLAR